MLDNVTISNNRIYFTDAATASGISIHVMGKVSSSSSSYISFIIGSSLVLFFYFYISC